MSRVYVVQHEINEVVAYGEYNEDMHDRFADDPEFRFYSEEQLPVDAWVACYELVTEMGVNDEWFSSHAEAAEFARTELNTETFEVGFREIPAHHITPTAEEWFK